MGLMTQLTGLMWRKKKIRDIKWLQWFARGISNHHHHREQQRHCSHQSEEVKTINISILQMKKSRLREVTWFIQVCPASRYGAGFQTYIYSRSKCWTAAIPTSLLFLFLIRGGRRGTATCYPGSRSWTKPLGEACPAPPQWQVNTSLMRE